MSPRFEMEGGEVDGQTVPVNRLACSHGVPGSFKAQGAEVERLAP